MSKLSILREPIPGIKIVELPLYKDKRGYFLKTFQEEDFQRLGINFNPVESFLTISKKNVLRGMHFQTESYSHKKLVFCSSGKVLDIIVDVRKTSNFFNKPFSIILEQENPLALVIDKGFAHGFLSLSENSCINYMTSTTHNPLFDKGVLWSSIDFLWPIKNPIISERDLNFPSIKSVKCVFS